MRTPLLYVTVQHNLDQIMSAKPVIQSTRTLTRRDSRALVRSVTSVTLTEKRREQLRQYTEDLKRAFDAELPQGVRRP